MRKADIAKIYEVTMSNGGSSNIKGNRYQLLKAQNGYIVGGFSDCIKVSKNFDDFSKAMKRIDKMLSNGDILGTWVYEGIIYIEQSKIIDSLDFAIEIGKLNNQIAIYDLEKQSDIQV